MERQLGSHPQGGGQAGHRGGIQRPQRHRCSGRKFSGNAFYFEELSAYHHGTILVDVDFEDMTRYLQVSQAKMRSKAIESVQARVVNLKSLNPDISIETMAAALAEAFVEVYGGEGREEVISPTSLALADLYQRYSSWEWRYGHTPKFDLEFETRFPWGEIQVGLSLKKGIITQATIYSDAMNPQLIEKWLRPCMEQPWTPTPSPVGIKKPPARPRSKTSGTGWWSRWPGSSSAWPIAEFRMKPPFIHCSTMKGGFPMQRQFPPPPAACSGFIYTVVSGDTMFSSPSGSASASTP